MSSFLGGGGGGGTGPGSQLATSNLEWWVSTTGSDSNPGTLAQPFATIQHAMNVAATFNYQGLFVPLIQVEPGTYNQNSIVPPLLFNVSHTGNNGNGALLQGDVATISNTIIDGGATHHIFDFRNAAVIWSFAGFQLQNTNSTHAAFFMFASGCTIGFDDIIFSSVGLAVYGNASSTINIGINNDNIFFQGGGQNMMSCFGGSQIFDQGLTQLFTGAQNYTGFVIVANGGSSVNWPLSIVRTPGNVTGARYAVDSNSRLTEDSFNDRSQYLGSTPGTIFPTGFIGEDPLVLKLVPADGSTQTLTPGSHEVTLVPATSLAHISIVMPTDMSTGEKTNIVTTQSITAVTWSTTDGSSIIGAPAGLAANGSITFLFSRSDNAWYCLGG